VNMQVDEAGASHGLVLSLRGRSRQPPGRTIHKGHTSRAAISIQVSDPTEKPPRTRKASRSLTNESIGTSKVSVPFLYVLFLFLSSDIRVTVNQALTARGCARNARCCAGMPKVRPALPLPGDEEKDGPRGAERLWYVLMRRPAPRGTGFSGIVPRVGRGSILSPLG